MRLYLMPANAGASTDTSLSQSSGPLFDDQSWPILLATSLKIHQLGFASPGAWLTLRTRLTLRSLLVKVPSSSLQAAAGNTTWANLVVSVGKMSLQMRNSAEASSCSTLAMSGSVLARFSPKIHRALTLPVVRLSIIWGIIRPGLSGSLSTPQAFSNLARASALATCW